MTPIVVLMVVVDHDWTNWLIIPPYAGVGLFLLWRRPREVVAWLLVAAAVLFPWVGASVPGSASQVVDGRADLAITLYAWCSAWASSLFVGSLAALAAVFPAGRLPEGRLGLAARTGVAVPIVLAILLAVEPTASLTFADGSSKVIELPLAVAPGWVGWPILEVAVYLGVPAALAVSIGTLIVRFRRALGPERAQLKWLLAALAVTLGAVGFAVAMLLLVDPDGSWMWVPAVLVYPFMPAAIGLAIRRYHLYDIDRIVSRSLAYLVVSGLLVAVFVGLVVSLQAVLVGVTHGETFAIAASTLAAFAMFRPLLRRVQAAVDRRFDRARVDAERTIDEFAGLLRGELELSTLCGGLVATADAAVRPDGIGVWVRDVAGAERHVAAFVREARSSSPIAGRTGSPRSEVRRRDPGVGVGWEQARS